MKLTRLTELQRIRELDLPATRRPPERLGVEATLLAEVEHAQRRLDAALEDLRRWRLSNPAGG
jgi:hypothetical protein